MSATHLQILTPHEMFYQGEVESLVVTTPSGEEGYMPGHIWCRKLLKDQGVIKLREPGAGSMRKLDFHKGFVEIREDFTVYVESASWKE